MLQSKDKIVEWIRKHDPHIRCLQQPHLRTKDLHRLKVKGWKQVFQSNGQKKIAGIAILISDKIDFKMKEKQKDTSYYSGEESIKET